MKQIQRRKAKGRVAKSVLRLPDLEVAKSAVLSSLSCLDAQRGYRHAIDEFVDWYCSEPRLSFSKTVVVRYRMHLELRRLAGGRAQICRIPWSGGEVHPVRGAEGFFPEESSDGRWIYFEHS